MAKFGLESSEFKYVLRSVGNWGVGSECEVENKPIIEYMLASGIITTRQHYYPSGDMSMSYEVTDDGLEMADKHDRQAILDIRNWYRMNTSTPELAAAFKKSCEITRNRENHKSTIIIARALEEMFSDIRPDRLMRAAMLVSRKLDEGGYNLLEIGDGEE